MGNQYLRKPDEESAQKHHQSLSHHSESQSNNSIMLSPVAIMRLQRTVGNAAVQRLLAAQRHPAVPPKTNTPQATYTTIQRSGPVCSGDEVIFEPLQVSPMQARMLGVYTDEQISQELYGRPAVPVHHLEGTRVEVMYSTLLPRWKPAFALGASEWERKEADKMEGKRRLWTPIEDSNRGGLVVGYYRSSGGYTEVHNTAGELIFQDEIGIESVRIPIIDDIVDALKQAGYVAVGLVDAWLQDNWSALGLPPPDRSLASMLGIPRDAVAYRLGRGAGHVLSLLQAAAEMVGGAALILGGGGEFMLGVATTPEGVGLVIMPVAVATIGAGTTVVVHGGALANAVFMSAKGTGTGGAPERKPWKITPEGTAETRVSNKFGRFSKSKSDGLWWSRDTTGHGGSVWKVFAEEPRGLRWKFDANEFGDIITGKHKGATGMFIPWDQLIPVP